MEEQKSTPSKLQTRLPLLFALTLALGMFIGQKLPHFDHHFALGATTAGGGTIDEILRYVGAKYVDSTNIGQLSNGAITQILSDLDPHSVYIDPDEMQAVEDDMSGGFEGIGVEFVMVEDTINVVAPISGGPAETVGVLAGDKIVTISDTMVAGVKIENGKIYKHLRGAKGTIVKIGILRGKETALRYFNIPRDIIPVKSLDVAYMADDKTGYFKINRFTSKSYQEFMEALAPLVEQKGLQNILLDLRGNPGGYMEEANSLLSQVFPDGKLLVYTKSRNDSRKEYKSNGRARFVINNIAVLIDEGSASASEIVAGAIQDWDRGWVIGRRSYGKGLVQEQYPLKNGGGLRLTVSRYYTPSGRSIQRAYKGNKEYRKDGENRLKSGELSDPSKFHVSDTTKYYTGGGRVVYGGGGISPDVFIPLDSSYYNDYFFALRQVLAPFVARQMESLDKGSLPQTLDAFVSTYKVSDPLFEALITYAESKGTKRDAVSLQACKVELRHQLKARMAKVLFGDIGLYRVLNDDDPAVEKALQVLKSGERLKSNG